MIEIRSAMSSKILCNRGFRCANIIKTIAHTNGVNQIKVSTGRPGNSPCKVLWRMIAEAVATTITMEPLKTKPSLNHLVGRIALATIKTPVIRMLSRNANAIMNAKISAISAKRKYNMKDESRLKKPSSDQL